MIKFVEDEKELYEYSKRDFFAVRTFGLLEAYGCGYPFLRFYLQRTGAAVTALVSMLDDSVTVSVTDGFDAGELEEFLFAVGFKSVICPNELCLAGETGESGAIMLLKKEEIEGTGVLTSVDFSPPLKTVFDMNREEIGTENFEAWYCDFHHRIRRGAARAYLLEENACVLASTVTADAAVISAVKVVEPKRHMGYGTAIVKTAARDLNRDIFIMRETGKNESFYKKIGFKNVDEWRLYRG